MPLVRKRRSSDNAELKNPAKKQKKSYEYLGSIGYQDDHHHALYRHIPDAIEDAAKHVAKNVVSFLNGDGGMLVYGVRENGKVYGEEISRREQDVLTNSSVDSAIKRIIPCVPTDLYKVSFYNVTGNSATKKQLKVVVIRVAPGEPDQIYEDINHEVYQRRGTSLYGPYTPHEIKDHTIKQIKKQIRVQARQKLATVIDTPKTKSLRSSQNKAPQTQPKKSSPSKIVPSSSSPKRSQPNRSSPSRKVPPPYSPLSPKRSQLRSVISSENSFRSTRSSVKSVIRPPIEVPPPYTPRISVSRKQPPPSFQLVPPPQPPTLRLVPPPPPPTFAPSRTRLVPAYHWQYNHYGYHRR